MFQLTKKTISSTLLKDADRARLVKAFNLFNGTPGRRVAEKELVRFRQKSLVSLAYAITGSRSLTAAAQDETFMRTVCALYNVSPKNPVPLTVLKRDKSFSLSQIAHEKPLVKSLLLPEARRVMDVVTKIKDIPDRFVLSQEVYRLTGMPTKDLLTSVYKKRHNGLSPASVEDAFKDKEVQRYYRALRRIDDGLGIENTYKEFKKDWSKVISSVVISPALQSDEKQKEIRQRIVALNHEKNLWRHRNRLLNDQIKTKLPKQPSAQTLHALKQKNILLKETLNTEKQNEYRQLIREASVNRENFTERQKNLWRKRNQLLADQLTDSSYLPTIRELNSIPTLSGLKRMNAVLRKMLNTAKQNQYRQLIRDISVDKQALAEKHKLQALREKAEQKRREMQEKAKKEVLIYNIFRLRGDDIFSSLTKETIDSLPETEKQKAMEHAEKINKALEKFNGVGPTEEDLKKMTIPELESLYANMKSLQTILKQHKAHKLAHEGQEKAKAPQSRFPKVVTLLLIFGALLTATFAFMNRREGSKIETGSLTQPAPVTQTSSVTQPEPVAQPMTVAPEVKQKPQNVQTIFVGKLPQVNPGMHTLYAMPHSIKMAPTRLHRDDVAVDKASARKHILYYVYNSIVDGMTQNHCSVADTFTVVNRYGQEKEDLYTNDTGSDALIIGTVRYRVPLSEQPQLLNTMNNYRKNIRDTVANLDPAEQLAYIQAIGPSVGLSRAQQETWQKAHRREADHAFRIILEDSKSRLRSPNVSAFDCVMASVNDYVVRHPENQALSLTTSDVLKTLQAQREYSNGRIVQPKQVAPRYFIANHTHDRDY